MEYTAKARYVRYTPYKLRPLADVIRGKDAVYALQLLGAHKVQGRWSVTYATSRAKPLVKVLASAVANAQNLNPNIDESALRIAEIRVDQGAILRYSKPTARGSASPQRKRFCHLAVSLVEVAQRAATKSHKVKAVKSERSTTKRSEKGS